MINAKTRPARLKNEYKARLAEQREEKSDLINSLSESMRNRLDRVYSALNGTYSYIDSHSGREVHARTYKKRLEFAEKELEGINLHLSLQYRYDTFSEGKRTGIENYLNSLYETAITDNSYLKKKNVRRSAVAGRVREEICTIGPSIESKIEMDTLRKTMRAGTGYTKAFVEAPVVEKPVRTKLIQRQRVPVKRADFASYADPATAKLSARDPTNFFPMYPYPDKPRAGLGKVFATIGFIAAGVMFSIAGFKYLESRKQPLHIESRPANVEVSEPIRKESVSIETPKPVIQPTISQTSTLPNKVSTYETSQAVIDMAKERVRLAKEKMESERAQARSYNASRNNVASTEVESPKEKVTYIPPTRKSGAWWDSSFLKRWEERSRKRALEEVVVKQVVYYPDGRVVVSYPNESHSTIVAMH